MRYFLFLLIMTLLSCGSFKSQEKSPTKPNILFIEVDDLTAKYLGSFGAEFAKTPNIDRMAEQGVVFENAVCQGAMCGPSRNSLISALYPHNLGFYANKQINSLPKGVWTFPKALQNEGYETFWVGKCHIKPYTADIKAKNGTERKNMGMKYEMGFDHVYQSAGRVVALRTAKKNLEKGKKWKNGKDSYADFLFENDLLQTFIDEKGETPTSLDPDTAYMDGHFVTKTIATLSAYQAEKPFFMWTNFSCPHGPFDVPQEYHDKFEAADMPAIIDPSTEQFEIPATLKPHKNRRKKQQTLEYRAAYSATVHYVDEQVGRLMDFIKNSRFSDNTMVVFFSDHGIMLGDHGLLHKSTLYQEVLDPALIIWYPEQFNPRTVIEPVELLDLAKTSIQIAGADQNEMSQCPNGFSLLPLLHGKKDKLRPSYACSEIEGFRSVYDGRYKYIDNDAFPILFDHEKDPNETTNFAELLPEKVAELKAKHDEWVTRSGEIKEVQIQKK